jgi:hypothetical protein
VLRDALLQLGAYGETPVRVRLRIRALEIGGDAVELGLRGRLRDARLQSPL